MMSDAENGSVGGEGPSGVGGQQVYSVSKGHSLSYPKEELPRVAPLEESLQEL